MSNFVNLLDIVYPVGSIYQSMNATSPADFIGGTWTKIKTFLYGADTAQETGGEVTHTLTKEEMPKHNHRTINQDCIFNAYDVKRVTVSSGTTATFSQGYFTVTDAGGGASTQQSASLHNLFHLVQNSIATLKANSLNLSEVSHNVKFC